MAGSLTAEALSFGLKLRLMSLGTIKSKLSTILIGARIGRYLVVEMPKVGGVPVKLDEETVWSVHFIQQGQVHTFATSVIGSVLRPYALTFMRYPAAVEIAPLRAGRRYPVNIQALVTSLTPPDNLGGTPEKRPRPPESFAVEVKGLVVDISSGGCRLGSTVQLPVGSRLTLSLYLPDNKVVSGLGAEVKRSDERLGTYFSGLLFLGAAPEGGRKVFDEFINSLEHTPLRL